MKIKKIMENLLYVGAIGMSIFLLFFVICCAWIGYDVKAQCRTAKSIYGKDCVESLMLFVDDKNQDFRSRNSAIWALGQLGDQRALRVLNKYYTGKIPAREPLGKTISQYELKKAVELARGGLNITVIFWRDQSVKK